MRLLRHIFAGATAFCIGCSAHALSFRQSGINLPVSTAAFETRFDIDEDGRKDVITIFQRRVLIFFQQKNGTYPTAPDVEIGAGQPIPEVYAAVSVGKITSDKGNQLVFIGRNGVDYLTVSQLRGTSAEPVEPRTLIQKKFDISPGPDLVFLDAIFDSNGNEQDELVLPNSDQLEFYEQRANGEVGLASKLYIPLSTSQRTQLSMEPDLLGSIALASTTAMNAVNVRPEMNRWYGLQFAVQESSDPFLLSDFNMDGRIDVITPRGISYQDENRKFTQTSSNAYDSVAIPTYHNRTRSVVAPNVVDFNGDRILDTFKVETSAAKFSPKTDLSVFLGRPDRSLPSEPNFVLRTRDFAYSDLIPVGDLNQDGAQDVALFHFDFQPSSASSQLKAYIRSGLDGELRFYLWDKQKNRLPEGFAFKHRVLVNYGIYGTRQLFQQQVVMNRDMNGDGPPDLVLKTAAQEISIFQNRGASNGFAANAASVIRTPTRFSSLFVDDLNGDKKGDLIVSGYLDDQDDRIIYSFFISE